MYFISNFTSMSSHLFSFCSKLPVNPQVHAFTFSTRFQSKAYFVQCSTDFLNIWSIFVFTIGWLTNSWLGLVQKCLLFLVSEYLMLVCVWIFGSFLETFLFIHYDLTSYNLMDLMLQSYIFSYHGWAEALLLIYRRFDLLFQTSLLYLIFCKTDFLNV